MGAICPSSVLQLSGTIREAGLTGAAARPGPRKTSWSRSGSGFPAGTWRRKKKQARSVSDLAGETLRHRCHGNLQLLQLLQSRERPVHVFDGPGDLVLLEVPLETETKTRPHCKKKNFFKGAPRPANNRSCDVNKTLCGFTFRVKRASL